MTYISRRKFLARTAAALGCIALFSSRPADAATGEPLSQPTTRPNVILVLTDDQGYGDLSCTGNPVLKTPNIDKLHDESIRFTDFHVAPMCTPTRGQIVTGVDCLANAAYIVCSGRSLARTEFPAAASTSGEQVSVSVPTIAQLFLGSGYRTGHFGKWHLGDNYPYRAMDRGFEESITIRGWGIGCSQDYWLNGYYDDHYWHDGTPEQYHGYCTDVWFEQASKWIKAKAQQKEPFFVYLPTNAPHVPLLVPEKYWLPYKGQVRDDVAHYFGMIACIDENLGRLDQLLKDLNLYDNTILIFMSDNGGQSAVKFYNAGMRGEKAEYYEGGHRVPCFIRWPAGGLRQPTDIIDLAECQDILPTLTDLCGIKLPDGVRFDGVSLAKTLRGAPQPELADRKLVVQFGLWAEFVGPKKWESCVMQDKWRLVKGKELYDIASDPGQETNVADKYPEMVSSLRDYYEQWWTRNEPLTREFQPIHLGSDHENPVFLGAEDWEHWGPGNMFGVRQGTNPNLKGEPWNGPWHVLVEREGNYEISLRRWPVEADAAITAGVPAYKGELIRFQAGKALPITSARLKIGSFDVSKPVETSDKAAVFTLHLPPGKTTLQTWFYDGTGKELCGAFYTYVRHLPDTAS